MAKSNKSKPIQLLSPENYIRQKARNLTIYECRINKTWQRDKMAQVLVARIHANGNITSCFYLVDLGCLGVKDSFYRFNNNLEEYSELLDKFNDRMHMELISYELAHNIVYAGVQYAEELGFKPHKDYTSVTRFMLEEDTEDTELIEIEMGGIGGKPLYVNSGFESESRANQILNQLEKTAGVGNFNYILPGEEDDFEDDDEDRDFEFSGLMLEKLKDEFLTLIHKEMDNLSQVEIARLLHLTDDIYAEICNDNKIYDYIDQWDKELYVKFTIDHTNEFIGIGENVVVKPKQYELIDDILLLFDKNNKKASKKIIELEKQIGKTSLIAFFELELLKENSSNEYMLKLEEYSHTYPECSLIKIISHTEAFKNKKDADLTDYLLDTDIIFAGRSLINEYEMNRYLIEKMFLISGLSDVNLIEAFFIFLDDFDLNERIIKSLKGITSILRIAILKFYLENPLIKTS